MNRLKMIKYLYFKLFGLKRILSGAKMERVRNCKRVECRMLLGAPAVHPYPAFYILHSTFYREE